MSSRHNETVNQFNVGDIVRKKGTLQEMEVVGNIPGGSATDIEHYLKTDKFECKWIDSNGNPMRNVFEGADLEVV